MIFHVNILSPEGGNGSAEAPFKHINDAAQVAGPGDEVLVAPGVYREYIDPANSGLEGREIVYRSERPLGAVITGAEELRGWVRYQGNTWVTHISNRIFGSYNPYTQLVEGDWFMGQALHTGDIYLNDRAMYESANLEECMAGKAYLRSWEPESAIYRWYTAQEDGETVIYANFQNKDPNQEKVEYSVRRRCIFPSREGRNYIAIVGFAVTKAATTWAPPSCHQDGMIGVNWSKGWRIEGCEISNSKCCGISLGRNYDPDNEQFFFHHQIKSANQMGRESICRALSQGWYKEQVGSHIVRRCHIHHCEQAGIIGRQGCIFSIIEDNHIHHISMMQQVVGAELAGIKLHVPIDVTLRRNHIHHCLMGIWLDWVAQGTRVTGNLLHDNQVPETVRSGYQGVGAQDLFIEASLGPTLIDNNVLLSRESVKIAAQGVACVHNLFCGSFTSVGGGTDQKVAGVNQPRYFSYHYAHSTHLMGFMSCRHGDNRFFNNIFVQRWPCVEAAAEKEEKAEMGFAWGANDRAGTFVWDAYPLYEEWIRQFDLTKKPDLAYMIGLGEAHFGHLPVWIAGNAYFNGALPYQKERGKFVCEEPVKVELTEQNGEYFLNTDIGKYLRDAACEPVSSRTLGVAFEPQERFEAPDGSDILFREDYLGRTRERVIPGPFAALTAETQVTV